MREIISPYLLEFSAIGDADEGFISVAEWQTDIPFDVKRIFWTYDTPENVTRGRHAHHRSEIVLVAASGRIVVTTELVDGATDEFVLDRPTRGVYLPPRCWRIMSYSPSTVQLAFVSTRYSPDDYIRDHDAFRRHHKP